MRFVLGDGEVPTGLEEAVVGMAPGQRLSVSLDAEDAFGPHRADLIREVPRRLLIGGPELARGDQVDVPDPQGRKFSVAVKAVTPTTVVLDANHPLAGEDLTFDIHLLEVCLAN